MSFRQPAIALAAVAFCLVTADYTPVAAQAPNCVDLYNQVMALYQTAPQSPQYNQMSAYYAASCLGGPSAGPAYPAPYAAPYPQYQQPAPIDPGAAILGGVIGGVIAGSIDHDHDHRRDRNRRYW